MFGLSLGAGGGNTPTNRDHDYDRSIHIYGPFGNPLDAEFTPKPWWTHACRCNDYTIHDDAYNFDASNLCQRFYIIRALDALGKDVIVFEKYWDMMQEFAKRNRRVDLREMKRKHMFKERGEWVEKHGVPGAGLEEGGK